ncbi:MAG: FKBP-type peptidyl-prolyl cis-trans isomerase [Pedobacter sp.]|uniref:FKBP-type peptidyl-prolyl cis-trans isomerase n=1 Tax=Pedobacter sp. TaxID=1411316 RepID=UPI003394872E
MIPRFPISITLDNGESFSGRVMFDTGNAFSLLVSAPFSKFHNFNEKLGLTETTSGRGLHAVTRDRVANIQALSFNGFKFGKMGIRLTVNDQAEPKDGYLGILGIEIIKRFNVILNYAQKRIYLKPNHLYQDSFSLAAFKKIGDPASITFLENNRSKSGIHTTSSGLQYEVLKQGDGPKPTLSDRVALHYKTTLVNGTKLWNTYDDQKPWIHHLDKTIEGVKEAALLMPAGSKWKLYIPAALAFGESGYEQVPPGAALIYELEVLNSEK